MMYERCVRLAFGVLLVGTAHAVGLPNAHGDKPIRARAVVDLTFDEAQGNAIDVAENGKHKDDGTLLNGAQRVASPFWNQSDKRALLLDADEKQLVRLADSPDVDRPDAVTLSFFYLNLHKLNDRAFHGIVAKRSAENPSVTNYGINVHLQNDAFQVYINDGSGYQVVQYGAKEVLGLRRRVYLTATFQVADAPAPDGDSDADDVRVRLFVNGKSVKPRNVIRGTVSGTEAWLTDVDASGLLNDVPLTLGSTNASTEFSSGLIDEFLLFDRALTPDDVSGLFREVAGDNAAELARQEGEPPPSRPEPDMTAVSLWGLQAGATTRLTIRGRNLAPQPRIVIPLAGLDQNIAENSDPGRVIADLTVPPETPPGFYPLRVQTANGLSDSVVIAVDRLPQASITKSTRQSPSPLPSAFSGTLSGSAQARVYFQGRAGQQIIADVEAKRLGAELDPVLEVKTGRGTPLLIEWGRVALHGDARAEITLPADGLYYVELHDLEYKARGRNPYRLKIGEVGSMKLIDAWFPTAVPTGKRIEMRPVGVGLPAEYTLPVELSSELPRLTQLLDLPADLNALGPAPAVRLSEAREVIESQSPEGERQRVSARFAEHVSSTSASQVGETSGRPVIVNGRISQPEEVDRYLLAVTPEQKLSLSLAGRSIGSPLDGRLSVHSHPEGKRLVSNDDRPGTRDPAVEYTVPENVERLQVSVRDLHGRGGPHFFYRLRIAPSGQADFRLTATTPKLTLPKRGTTIARLQLTRNGYNGPIQLTVVGAEGVSVQPEQIPAGGGDRSTFLTLTHTGDDRINDLQHLRLVGESVGLIPPVRRVARVAPGPIGETSVAHRDLLPMAVVSSAGASVAVNETPPALFKGVPAELALHVARRGSNEDRAVRFTLMSTETPRPVDPRDPQKGNKPLVRAVPGQHFAAGTKSGSVRLAVPLDVAESAIDFVVRADVVAHPYAEHVLATGYSRPFRLPVKNALRLQVDQPSLTLIAGRNNTVRGTVKRAAGFEQPVDIVLKGLPVGYSASKVTVPADQENFAMAVTAGEAPKPKDLSNVKLQVSVPGGGPVLPARTIALKVVPPPKAQPVVAPKP